MNFDKVFNEEAWATHLGQHFTKEEPYISFEPIIKDKFDFVVSIKSFGTLFKSDEDEAISVYIVSIKDTKDTTRIKITRMLYEIIKNDVYLGSALFFILYENKKTYRFSFVKVSREVGHDGIKSVKSDPKRYTYLLGEGIKTHTAETRLRESVFTSRENIETAFSVEPVNQEFYKGIYEYFNKVFDDINSDFKNEKKSKEFSLRFIGRIVFCWFLKEKDLIDKDFLSSSYLEENETINYYDEMLSILFFEILNRDMNERTIKNSDINKYASEIPFLNGGLFSKSDDDYIETGLIKNETIKKLFLFLEKYNFTVDESTPIDIEVSIDPEMLGRIFENLLADINPVTEVSARKETGAFYTPREIVDYMVVESIKTYIKKSCCENVSEERIDELFLLSEDTVYTTLEKKEILKCIHKMKILDPACGSGAFPMGMLQRIFMLINRLDHKNEYYRDSIISSTANSHARKEFEKIFDAKKFSYGYKLQILKSTIYSVDIEPIAIEIARLRAFLSLIVEENKDLNDSDNLGIKPLPNLEFQFIIANSLVGLSKDGGFDSFWANIFNTMIERIEKISKEYFEANTEQAKKLVKFNFEAFRGEVERTDIDDELKNRLLSWNPFDNTSTDFFDYHIQFGIDENIGFDIVLGNPPYVQLQSMDKVKKETFKNENYKMFASTGDIYQLFFEKCFNLLSPDGVVSLITSNKWMRAGYGEFTRRFFMDNASVHKVLDLGGGRFESATVDTSIIFYGKKNSDSYNKERSINAVNFKLSLDELQNTNIQESQSIKITSDAWIILSATEKAILDKMNSIGKPLKEWDISINYGIKTGFNEAFIIDGATKDSLIKEDSKSEEIIKPLLRGRDIKRYSYEFADKWIIFIPWHFPLHKDNSIQGSSEKAEKTFEKEYPAIYKHLLQYKKQLSARNKAETGIRYEWYALQRCAATYYEDFEKSKIVWGNISTESRFCYSSSLLMINAPANILVHNDNNTQQLLYILGILNSTSFNYQFVNSGITLGSAFEWKRQYMEPLLIPTPSQKDEREITALVDTILDKKSHNLETSKEEAKIDEIVYSLYGLSDDEILLVEGVR